MKSLKLFIATFVVMYVNVLTAQQNSNELIQDFRVKQAPSMPAPDGMMQNNSLDVSFKLVNPENIESIELKIVNKVDGRIIEEMTISVSNEGGAYFFMYGIRKRGLKRNYVAFPAYIGTLNLDDVTITARITDSNNEIYGPLAPNLN